MQTNEYYNGKLFSCYVRNISINCIKKITKIWNNIITSLNSNSNGVLTHDITSDDVVTINGKHSKLGPRDDLSNS